MAIAAICPCCQRRLRVPEDLAGRRVTCPRCGDALRVPPPEAPEGVQGGSTAAGRAEGELAPAARLGVAAIALGLVSVVVLCLPLVGYAALGLSGVGLALGVWGLARSPREAKEGADRAPAAGTLDLGGQTISFPLAGAVLCLVVLALAVLPLLFR